MGAGARAAYSVVQAGREAHERILGAIEPPESEMPAGLGQRVRARLHQPAAKFGRHAMPCIGRGPSHERHHRLNSCAGVVWWRLPSCSPDRNNLEGGRPRRHYISHNGFGSSGPAGIIFQIPAMAMVMHWRAGQKQKRRPAAAISAGQEWSVVCGVSNFLMCCLSHQARPAEYRLLPY
jgi:hypothetical protein